MEAVPEKVEKWDAETKLRRYCFLGSLEPVYVHLRGQDVNVATFLPIVSELCKQLDDEKMINLLKDVLHNGKLVRRDEVLFSYATYFDTTLDIKWKTTVRQAFPALIKADDDLFLFCKYAKLIQSAQQRKGLTKTVRKAITAWYEHQPPEDIRNLWLTKRGQFGMTHKALLKLCHISDAKIGDKNMVHQYFRTCTELLQESKLSSSLQATEEAAPMQIDLPPPVIVAMSSLRTSSEKDRALKLLREHNLLHDQVPTHLPRHDDVMETMLPSMSYMQLLKSWRTLARHNHFDNPKIMKLCRTTLNNTTLLQEAHIHPIVFLLLMHKYGMRVDFSKLAPKKVDAMKMPYFRQLYHQSFGNYHTKTPMKMLIAINLQTNYRKKNLKNHKKLPYLEAAVALAFGYYKSQNEVDVFHWMENSKETHNGLVPIGWTEDMNVGAATAHCNTIQNTKNSQRLLLTVMEGIKSKKKYDVFVAIVPTAGRSNPHKSSDLLYRFLERYRETFSHNAKLVIINLMKLRKSMKYSAIRNENILEICGLDAHTPNLIDDFVSNRFG